MPEQSVQNTGENPEPNQGQQFRGAVIHVNVDGTFKVELVGINRLELFAVVGLIHKSLTNSFEG